HKAVLVQENVPLLDQSQWTPSYFDNTISHLVRISVEAAKSRQTQEPGLIIWPESPAPLFISDPRLQQWLVATAQDTNSYLVIGSIGETEGPIDKRQLLNSALVVDPRGNTQGRYDKIHLVPFGEYIPMQNLLFFASKLTHEVGDYARGTERKVFDMNGT